MDYISLDESEFWRGFRVLNMIYYGVGGAGGYGVSISGFDGFYLAIMKDGLMIDLREVVIAFLIII